MSIWTILGQVVNFLIFVGILRVILYRPVKRLMEKRRKEMKKDLDAAEKKLQEAEGLRREVEKKKQELDEEGQSALQKAREKALKERDEVLDRARDKAKEELNRFRRIMEEERDQALQELTDRLRDVVIKVSHKVMEDAAADLMDRSVARVEKTLGDMDDEDRKRARQFVQDDGRTVEVRAAYPLGDDRRRGLRESLAKVLEVDDLKMNVEEDASLLAGIEVQLGETRVDAHWRGAIEQALAGTERPSASSEEKEKPPKMETSSSSKEDAEKAKGPTE